MRAQSSRFPIFALVVVLALLPISAVSATKVTPGSSCKTVKQKVVYLNKVYTCTQVGKKKVWSKGVAVVKETPVPTPTPTPTPTKAVDDVQKVIDEIRNAALSQPYANPVKVEYVFQSPTSIEVETKTKRSLDKAIPVYSKLGFPVTDGLVIVAKDDNWLREELIRNGCRVSFAFPQSTGFYVAKSCTSGNGALVSRHWDVMKFSDGLDGLYFNHTIPHEYFHQIQSTLIGSGNPQFPKWFGEGSAQFFTNQAWVTWNPQKSYPDWFTHWWTELNPTYGPKLCKSVSIKMMSDYSTPGAEGVCAYSKGQMVVEYLVYKYGLTKFRELHLPENYTNGRDFEQAFKALTNDDLNSFYLEADIFMKQRGW
jgi:hypothetical protein